MEYLIIYLEVMLEQQSLNYSGYCTECGKIHHQVNCCPTTNQQPKEIRHIHDFEPKESDGFVEVCKCGRSRMRDIPFD